jgi:hypothetical protein
VCVARVYLLVILKGRLLICYCHRAAPSAAHATCTSRLFPILMRPRCRSHLPIPVPPLPHPHAAAPPPAPPQSPSLPHAHIAPDIIKLIWPIHLPLSLSLIGASIVFSQAQQARSTCPEVELQCTHIRPSRRWMRCWLVAIMLLDGEPP